MISAKSSPAVSWS